MDSPLNILVVDDDEIDRLTVTRSLKAAGIEANISEASNFTEAIAALEENKFDCIFIDYRLPDQDGLALVQELRHLGVKVPLVVLTGQGDEQIAVELMKAGASDYLSKDSVSPESLSRRVYSAIRIYQAQQETELANQRLQESEERYRAVVEGSNDGIWDWDFTQNKLYWNDRLLDIVGLSREEFSGAPDILWTVLHPEDRDRAKAALGEHLQNKVPYDLEVRLSHVSGDYRHCIIRAKAQRDTQGKPFRMAGVVIDITERKRAEQRLAAQNEFLRRIILERDEIARQREDFVSRLTHDLRTPLVAADRMLNLLLQGTFGDLTQEIIDILTSMVGSNQNLLQMVNTLLEVYRYEAGRKSLTFSNFDLDELITDVINELKPLALEKNIAIQVQVDQPQLLMASAEYQPGKGSVGEPAPSERLRGDRLEIRRIMTNLIGNAIKFTDTGSVDVNWYPIPSPSHPTAENRGDWIEITVRDTGAGIAPEEQSIIFERFRQSRDRRSGSGLGLYLSRRIVEAHRGFIRLQSAPNQGSLFIVQLPRDPEAIASKSAPTN